ncbi:MAG TPA: beta-galactosidase [Planctomycetota bacterium]|nr:beta-galactosidase [Planctomycetota bacterium]
MITSRLPHVFFGGDYNPEQWPESVWLEDMRLMREAGVNLVSIGIFSWAKLEPRPGEYDFAWLDRIMDLLAKNAIFADLATASASPPPWLARLHPESLPQNASGTRYFPGARQHYCPNSAAYKSRAAELTRRLARRYKDHPALAMWHINNEYACHVSECFCDVCAAEFRVWLQARYGLIDELNRAWGTAFWSQQYSTWNEILPPRKAPTFCNPAQQLDYKRFMNDSVFELCLSEANILKQITPGLPLTTNFMGWFKPLDYFQWAKALDFVSWDSYPDPSLGMSEVANAAANHDLMRSLKGGQPFVLMEQAPSAVNWRTVNVPKPPGLMRLWSYQALAHGADGILYFQWRAAQAGAEKFHSGMVPHAGENTRVFSEIKQLGHELKKLDGILDSRVPAQVAIVMDWQSRWALELDSHPAPLQYVQQLRHYYDAMRELNIAVDFVAPEGDFSPYKLVLAPALYLVRYGGAENVRMFVARGGTFLTTFFSGIVDENDTVQTGGYPLLLRDVLGVWVEEWDPFPPGRRGTVQVHGSRDLVACDTWGEVVHLCGAKVLATFADGWYAGKPALTLNKVGEGRAFYCATQFERGFTLGLLENICADLKIAPPLEKIPSSIEVCVRSKPEADYLFVLNHSDMPQTVKLQKWKGVDLLSGKKAAGTLKLGPFGVAVIESK